METSLTPPSVVVGIDGSRAAMQAALWAVNEAVSRDIPLRLLYVVEHGNTDPDPDNGARKLATAEIAIRQAFMALEATNKPVKIEMEIVQGHPITALVRASRAAAMVCVGAIGLNHFQVGRVGSTAAALATDAHCPLAIVRGRHGPPRRDAGWILAHVDESPDSGVVLETAMTEAHQRGAPLRVVACWRSRSAEVHDGPAVADGNRRVRAALDRRLAGWTRRHPGVELESDAVHDSFLNYLAKNAGLLQLVILGARDRDVLGQLVGPAGNAVLQDTDCSVLIVDRQHL